MRSLYKTLGALTIAAAMMFGSFQTADAAKRRVVLEDHTGAWCGWCVRGTETLRQLTEEYGEDFIPVAIHNGDGMAYSEIQSPLYQINGSPGYPSGAVNRMLFSGQSKIGLSDGAWNQATQIVYNSFGNVWADIDLEWSLTPQGQLSANVTVTADADATGEYGINLYVMEDGVTGSGSGYNQQNYLSGHASFVGHYYYDKPAVIQGYVHDNVLRYMLSGYDGKLSPIAKTTIKAGDKFSELFQQDVSARVQNIDNVWVVAVIQNISTGNYEIVNAKMDGKVLPTVAKVEIANDGNTYNKHDAGTEVKENITVTNPNDFEITVDLSINSSISIIPTGWTTKFSKNGITIPANSEVISELTLKTTNTAGFAQIAVKAEARSTDDIKGKTALTNIYSLSNSTKNLVLVIGNSESIMTPIISSISTSPISQSVAVIPFSNEAMDAYPIEDFDLTYISMHFNSRSTLGASTLLAQSITDALQKGKKILISTPTEVWWSTSTTTNFTPPASAEAKNLFNNVLGIASLNNNGLLSPVATNSAGQVTTVYAVPLVGVDADPIFSGLNVTLNNYSSAHQYYTQYIDRFSISNPTTTEAFVHYNLSGVTKAESIAGVKVTLPSGGKAIVTGFTYEIAGTASERSSLLNKSIEWLNAAPAAVPVMVLNADNLDFGKVGEATDLDFEVSNTGDAELVIDNPTISLDDDGAFTVKTLTTNKVAAGSKTKIGVTYTPKDGKKSTAVLRVNSNAGSKSVALSGEGVESSVDDYLANTGLFVMNVTPNPVASQSVFQYELNSNSAENVELKLIDANGNLVATLFNGIQTPGTHTINLDANQYANGKYFIIANLLGHSAQFPVVVTK